MADEVNYKAELVGVFGYPVAENPTIVMQEAAFTELGLKWRYLTIEVKPADLANAIAGLRAFNMRGINLTIPHKVAVLKYLDEVAPDAQLIGAVNTVRREQDRLIGENTDGKGFIQSLKKDIGISPEGKRVVVLGAGGAARAITVELSLAGATHISIVNRTERRGQELAALLMEKTQADALYHPWIEPFSVPPDVEILVNATSIGLFPEVDSRPNLKYESIKPGLLVCDVIPNPPQTQFLREAANRGATILDGLGMLVYQGAIGFKMWTGYNAPINVMRQSLAKAFQL
jgi:shikimate dehydrogenase